MRRLIERITEDVNNQIRREFSRSLPVRFIHSDYEYEDIEAMASYYTDVLYDELGISNIHMDFYGSANVEVESFESGSGNSRGMKKFSIDLPAATKEWKAGNSYRPEEIEVYLNPDESISRVIVNCNYITKR